MDLSDLGINELYEELEAAEMSCDGDRIAAIRDEIEKRQNSGLVF